MSNKKGLSLDLNEEGEDGVTMVKSPMGKGIAFRYPTRRESLMGMGALIPTTPTPTHADQQSVASEQTGGSGNNLASPRSKRPSFLQGKSPQNAAPAVVKPERIEEVSTKKLFRAALLPV